MLYQQIYINFDSNFIGLHVVKMSKENLLQETSKGNFKVANKIIRSTDLLDSSLALKVVIECCRIFTKNENDLNVNYEEIVRLLNTCSELISIVDCDNTLSYFRSVYYIFKYLIDKVRTIILFF